MFPHIHIGSTPFNRVASIARQRVPSVSSVACNDFAAPGAIGVHKSSFGDYQAFNAAEAVSAVQQTTAYVIAYMVEMGIDPALLSSR